MYELPRYTGLDAFALDLLSTLMPIDLMSECKQVPSELKLVWFNSPGNSVPFATHSCDGFFASLKYEILIDILESDFRIEYVGQVVKKYLVGWLSNCRQVWLGAKGAAIASVNEFYNEFGKVIKAIREDVKYTCNVALMFYNNLAPGIRYQIKAIGYLPPDKLSDNLSQVQALCAL
jgi:hypothetical protein